jgi:hypothetical protein
MTSPLQLEQQRHGERPRRPEDAAAVADLDAKDAALLERLPPEMVGARIRDALRTQPRSDVGARGFRPWTVMPALAAAVVVVVVVVAPNDRSVDGSVDMVVDGSAGDRLKGAMPSLDVQVLDGTAVRALAPGERVGSGTRVQLRIKAAGAAHGVVVSVDGSGHVTTHFPDSADTRLPKGVAQLPFSFELDDAPGFERFFLVTGPGPIDVVAVTDAAKALSKVDEAKAKGLSLPAGLVQTDVLVLKRP